MQSGQTPPAQRQKALGMVVWKAHWTLSLKGKLVGLGLGLGLALLVCWNVHAFLAVNDPLRGEVLIVEGWIPVYTVHKAAKAFAAGQYRRVLVVRPLYEGEEGVVHGRNAGEYMASVLVRGGVPQTIVEAVYFPGKSRDRTFYSALGVKQHLAELGETIKSLDVVTMGPHARRSRLLYRKAFGDTAEVGVIALADPAYDGQHWWRTSEGVREVMVESIAYIYARFFS